VTCKTSCPELELGPQKILSAILGRFVLAIVNSAKAGHGRNSVNGNSFGIWDFGDKIFAMRATWPLANAKVTAPVNRAPTAGPIPRARTDP